MRELYELCRRHFGDKFTIGRDQCYNIFRSNGLCQRSLFSIVIRFTTRSILNEGKTTGTVILIASLTIGIGDTVEEIFRIKHLMKSFEIVGVRDSSFNKYS